MDEMLLKAYRETDYRVAGNGADFVIRIGEHSPGLNALLVAQGLKAAAFLTAWNPFSEATDTEKNEQAQVSLETDVARLGLVALPGEGVGRDGNWPPEPSSLIMGITRDQADFLARKYRQNAWVWIESGRAAELVITAA